MMEMDIHLLMMDEMEDPGSVLHHYRQLIRLRHELEVVAHGDVTFLADDHPQVLAYVRTFGEERLTVLANLSPAAASLRLGSEVALATGDVVLASAGPPPLAARGRPLRLAPWQTFAVLRAPSSG